MNPDLIETGTAEAVPCDDSRRRFLSRLTMGLGAIAGALVAVPCVGFLLGLRKVPSAWRTVGKIEEFQIGGTVKVSFRDPSPLPWAGVTARTAAWLRRNSQTEFVAFAVDCTHLGCPVRWLAAANLFMCPCHGGVYYANGTVAAGPPPRPLPRYPVRIQGDQVQILTSPVPITT